MLCWAQALGEFGATITFAGSFPGRTETMPIAVYYALEHDPDEAIVLSLVLLAFSVVVLVMLRDRWLRRRISRVTLLEPPELEVDAEVVRGSFTLRLALRAAPGEVLGILGPNGSGKSTLLAAVAGLIPVDTLGSIRLGGQVMDDAAEGSFLEAGATSGRLRLPGLPALPPSRRPRQRGVLPPARG